MLYLPMVLELRPGFPSYTNKTDDHEDILRGGDEEWRLNFGDEFTYTDTGMPRNATPLPVPASPKVAIALVLGTNDSGDGLAVAFDFED